MACEPTETDPNLVAAIAYRSDDDIDSMLADFGEDLVRSGIPVGGIVQRNSKDAAGRLCGMAVIDLMTGHRFGISQMLGPGSGACKLDAAGLADASRAVRQAIAAEVGLIIINKFSKQEAAGRGLRDEIAEAIQTGRPVLTAVPASCMEAWRDFTGDRGTTLFCAREVIEDWWRGVHARQGARATATLAAAAAEPAACPPCPARP